MMMSGKLLAWLRWAGYPYELAARLRLWAYEQGWFQARRLPRPVISVGNLTVGGTGKTPVVMYVVDRLIAQGKRVAILSRGYRRDVPGTYEIKRLQEAGRTRGHEVEILSPAQFKILIGGCDVQNVFIDGKGIERPDVIMSRMGAASTYLSISVVRHMLFNNVMVINSAEAIEQAIDKLFTMQVLAQKNIPIPKTMFAKCPIDAEVVTRQIGYPVIVKTLKGTQGGGVFLCETPDSLRDLSEILVHQGANDTPVLFQEFIATSRGRDVRAFCVGGKVLAGNISRVTIGGRYR